MASSVLDYLDSHPQLNGPVPNNPLRVQDALRRVFTTSSVCLCLNRFNVLLACLDATFFQIHTKFTNKYGKGEDLQQFIKFWMKTDKNFRVFVLPSRQQSNSKQSLSPQTIRTQESFVKEGSKASRLQKLRLNNLSQKKLEDDWIQRQKAPSKLQTEVEVAKTDKPQLSLQRTVNNTGDSKSEDSSVISYRSKEPSMTGSIANIKWTRKQPQTKAIKRRLRSLFQTFSLGNKCRKGITFDNMKQEFNKMDLTGWMAFNKHFNTVSTLGTEEVHYVFKRYCRLSLLDFQRFQKAFRDLGDNLYPNEPHQVAKLFGIDSDFSGVSKARDTRLPALSTIQERQVHHNKSPKYRQSAKVHQLLQISSLSREKENSFVTRSNANLVLKSVRSEVTPPSTGILNRLDTRMNKYKNRI